MSEYEAGYDTQLGLYAGELARLVRRLRGLSLAAWRSRIEPVRTALVSLIDIEATTTGGVARPLPVLPEYALADAVAVIGADVYDALSRRPDAARLANALSIVRSARDVTK